jgi:ethanolamine-phosphate phospho-lyase
MHESMVSCGGQVMIPEGYLKSVYGEVRAAGGIIIADEVQTGFGRMGTHFWGFQTFNDGIIPDIVTLGKPMGNGHPVACVVTTREIAASFQEFSPQYYNTFAGNAVSAAVATAVLDVVEEKKLQDNAHKVGTFLLKGLEKLRDKYPSFIGDVRGSGLFLGIDLVKNSVTKEPSAEIATFLAQRLREERIIMPAEGIYDNVLKIKPPMVFMEEDAEHLLSTLDLICSEIPGKFIH